MRRLIFWSLALTLVAPAALARAAPTVTAPVFADVTPRSFAVVWVSDEAATGTVRVFSDAAGTSDITATLGVLAESPLHPPAEDNGVHRVRVTGLSPDTPVYVQTETTSQATGEQTLLPPAPPFPGVLTEVRLRRADESERPLMNDQIAVEVRNATGAVAPGVLVLIEVAGARYPLSVYTGEGPTPLFGLIDLNNLFDAVSGETSPALEAQVVTLTAIGGSAGVDALGSAIPLPSEFGVIQGAPGGLQLQLLAGPDSDGDTFPDSIDSCEAVANLTQADRGSFVPSTFDGIGDACQCGDPDDDGDGDQDDVDGTRQALALLGPGLASPEKCNVIGPADGADLDGDGLRDDCAIDDVAVMMRSVAGLAPGAGQVCEPALSSP